MTNMEWILSTQREHLISYISGNCGVHKDTQELKECLSLPCDQCEFGPANASKDCEEGMMEWLGSSRKLPKEED